MRKLILIIAFFLTLIGKEVQAKPELSLDRALGLTAGFNSPPGLLISARFLEKRHTFFGAETFAVLPWGVGINLFLDLVRTDRLTIKLLDLGLFFPIVKKLSVPDIQRDYDLVLGSGLMWHYSAKTNFFLDWRAYLPDPSLIFYYGDFIRPIYKQALRESQLCLGISWRL